MSPRLSHATWPAALAILAVLRVWLLLDDSCFCRYATLERDFQIPQDIPAEVWQAYEGLVAAGFTWNVIKED